MKRLVTFGLALLVITSLAASAFSQEEKPFYDRWELKFTNETPEPFTYKNPLGERTNYFYMLFTVTNNTDEVVRTRFSISIVTETDKIYRNSLVPFAEREIIVKEQKLSGLVEGDQNEVIEELKKNKRYLNVFEIDRTPLKPGETREGLAIFEEIDPNADSFTLYVGGLVDPLKITETGDFILENQVYCIDYFRAGDEFARHLDFIERKDDRWIVQDFGPIGDKELIRKFIEALAAGDEGLPKDITEKDKLVHRSIMADLLKVLTGESFGYDPASSEEAQQEAIQKWVEWWKTNKYKLVWCQEKRKYIVRETPME